jgi:hypothetical protein
MIGQQVRYLLALAQTNTAPPSPAPHVEKRRNSQQSRIAILARLATYLSEIQIKTLLKEASQIPDVGIRISLIVDLAAHLAPHHYPTIAREIWPLAHQLPEPITRTRLLLRMVPMMSLVEDEPAVPENLLEVVALAQAIHSVEARMRAFVALAPHLPPTMQLRLLRRVFDESATIHNDALRCNTISAISETLPKELEARALDIALMIETPSERARALTALARQLPPEMQPKLRRQALETINTIRSEEERTDALIAFVPNLEYASGQTHFPELLAHALSIAVGMTRRYLRARALVALAPHLTLDLQGETLAVVHGLSNETERANLLAELAPHLPPDMLVASLAVAHTMREQSARVHALTALARHVPEKARNQTLLDALAAASNLPQPLARVMALISLVNILPLNLQAQAYTNALETSRLIQNENARARALSMMGAYLPPELLARAVEAANQLNDLQQRMNALIGIVPYLEESAKQETLTQLLDSVHQIKVDYKRARALVTIAPLLTSELMPRALDTAMNIADPFDQVSAAIPLMQHLPPEQRPQVVDKIWGSIQNIENGYDKASALAAIAPFLPIDTVKEIAQSAGMVIGSIMDEYDQASAISILAPLLAGGVNSTPTPALPQGTALIKEAFESALSIPHQALRAQLLEECVTLWQDIGEHSHHPEKSVTLWNDIMTRLAALPLADVLLCLGALLPMIRIIAGENHLKDIVTTLGIR